MRVGIWMIAVLLFAILLALTNPDYEAHKEVIDEQVFKESATYKHPFLNAFRAAAESMVSDMALEYHKRGVFSVTTYGDDVVTVGFQGMVFYWD